jgi:hypothetical protein
VDTESHRIVEFAPVSCTDARVIPTEFLKVNWNGTLYKCLRNAASLFISTLHHLIWTDGVGVARTPGGRVPSIFGGILAIDTFAGFSDILVIHHTGMCLQLHHYISNFPTQTVSVLICTVTQSTQSRRGEHPTKLMLLTISNGLMRPSSRGTLHLSHFGLFLIFINTQSKRECAKGCGVPQSLAFLVSGTEEKNLGLCI